ncbi:hypothetical protein SGM_4845 [Streptomyces griseoaurantiacus M045]|uniref:Uncharacterized protein n=1 Tax=Streptomyces griseoaurantiacus M045 TaxID=996637 RepID=F3NNY1_9ACTN|nr:hypothetical protein SGM_4845 [Streptomyces griseoaurantiacus M045]
MTGRLSPSPATALARPTSRRALRPLHPWPRETGARAPGSSGR